jgi:hypothetical protein
MLSVQCNSAQLYQCLYFTNLTYIFKKTCESATSLKASIHAIEEEEEEEEEIYASQLQIIMYLNRVTDTRKLRN